MEKVELTTALEYMFGASKIDSAEKLTLLIKTLREMPNDKLDMESIKKVMAKMQASTADTDEA